MLQAAVGQKRSLIPELSQAAKRLGLNELLVLIEHQTQWGGFARREVGSDEHDVIKDRPILVSQTDNKLAVGLLRELDEKRH